jgi:pimeloyl-ACP methyl ester carboxylesterase
MMRVFACVMEFFGMQSAWWCAWIMCTALFTLSPVQLVTADPAAVFTDISRGHLVDIGGGRRMNIVCLGHGSPTVMFEYGLGGNLLNWERIAGPVSELSTACFYDRAGYGDSDASSRAMTAQNVTDDLHWLLDKARVRKPIVLVGHSLGGLYATLYADRFPLQVAGLVLIDPAFAGQDLGETPEEKERAASIYAQSQVNIARCTALAHQGLSSSNPAGCFELPPNATPSERAYLVRQYTKPARWDAMLSESKNLHAAGALSEDELEEQRAARSFGDNPVIVVTAGTAPKQPDETEAEHQKNMAHWKAGHDRLAARSSRGESIVVPNATHMIQLDQPQAVIEAIRKAVLTVRAAKTKAL